ncbi:MAG TPA: hypothetical protein VGR92_21610 [Steroidobacteraceae bacterium]|nr:hypothetical protein [Steroidobacteraceae bacterium]
MNHALALADWQSFYVLVGSSAGALTGLTFVVITVSADRRDETGSASARLTGLRVFITPTAVHFGAALWLSALMCIPGQTALVMAVLLAGTGLAGLLYCATLVRRMFGSFPGYKPFLSDWIWNAVLPVAAYLTLAASGLLLPRQTAAGLYIVSGAVLLLLFIGIHNAWDVVVWMTTERHAHRERQRRAAEARKGAPD